MKKVIEVPFVNGSQIGYPESWRTGFEWKANYTFETTLIFERISRGRSRTNGIFKDLAGHTYSMFMKDFQAIIPEMSYGQIEGTFTFVKRGANYGMVKL